MDLVAAPAGVEALEGGDPMTPQQLDTLVDNLRRFEGASPWMYLDTHDPPLVTVGIGVMLPDVGDAVALPFQHVIAGRGATEGEIAQAYAHVKSCRGGLGLGAYKCSPPIELEPEEVTALAVRRLEAVFLPGLQDLFTGFYGFPWPAQQVLVDMAWNLGLTGLGRFGHLRSAAMNGDWARAAAESHVATSRPARNEWRRDTFLSCQ